MTSVHQSARRDAVARLADAQKSNRGAAPYSRWVNRPIGRQMAAVAYVAGLTPNQVSTLSALFTFPAIVALAIFRPGLVLAVVVVLMLVIGYALDSADGQVARLRGGGSVVGEWLDHVLDSLKVSSIHLAVAVAWFRFFGFRNHATLLIPLAFAVVSSVFFFALVLTDMLRRIVRLSQGQTGITTASLNPNERAPVLRSLIVLPNDYGVLCLVFILLPWPRAFAVVYAALALCNALFLVTGSVRWFKELSKGA